MKKSVRYLLTFLGLFILILICLLYYTASKLSSEDIKSFLTSRIEKMIPGSEVRIAQISYVLGASINFNIRGVDIKLKKNHPGRELFFVDTALVQVPIWAMFSKEGRIDIIVTSPQIQYYEYRNGSHNWSSLTSNSVSIQKKERSGQYPFFLNLFNNSRINIKLSDATIFYQTREDLKGELKVHKFLLKNKSLQKPTVFEIQSAIKWDATSQRQFSSNLLMVGEFDTTYFFQKGHLKSKMEIKLMENRWLGRTLPDISAGITLSNRKGRMVAQLKLNDSELVENFKGRVLLGKTTFIDQLQGQINFKRAKFSIAGSIKLADYPVLNIEFKSQDKIQKNIGGHALFMKPAGTIQGRRITLNVPFEIASGVGRLSFSSILPREIVQTNWENLSSSRLGLILNGMTITKSDVHQIMSLYKKISIIPEGQFTLLGKKIALEKSQFDIKGKIVVKGNMVNSQNLSLKTGRGRIDMGLTSMIAPDSISTTFDIKMKQIPLQLFSFLGSKISGTTNTKLSGNLQQGTKGINYDILLNSSNDKGKIDDLKLKSFIHNYGNNIPILKGRSMDISNQFKKLIVRGRFRNDHLKLQIVDFIGAKNQIQFKGGGNLYPLNKEKKGEIYLNFKDKKGIIPIRLQGTGLLLQPDYSYTLKKM